jgi:triosephosphate isomerase
MRKKIIAGNWKMNLSFAEAMALAGEFSDVTIDTGNCSIILAPPFIYLHDVVERTQSHPDIFVSAQNCSSENKGAFTGEVSASMLASIGVDYVIVGHSERRQIFGEADDVLAKKINLSLQNGLSPIFCCGEELSQRETGRHQEVVSAQLLSGLFHVDKKLITECIIAYEPVWAIGTGRTATSEQAQEMHAFIREQIASKYGNEIAQQITILYGGSVTSKNSAELFNCKDVDGGLVGGASLKAQEFMSIIHSMNSITQ